MLSSDRNSIRQQLEVYDALYAWCRLQVAVVGATKA
jgi:hypothetical protein